MPNNFSMKYSINRSYVKENEPTVIFSAIDITPDVKSITKSKVINVALAIDCSGSMAGEKFDNALKASAAIIRSLTSRDWISIIAFEKKVETIYIGQLNDVSRLEEAINNINLGSETDLYGGLETAYDKLLKNYSPQTINHIVLLTDGQPTRGKKKEKDFLRLCDEIRQRGVTVNALGIGDDYNEKLLTNISRQSGGLWYHVSDPNSLPGLFKEQVSVMQKTIIIKPQLHIKLLPNIQLLDLFTVRPMLTKLSLPKPQDNQYSINLKDIVKDEEQNIVFRLKVPNLSKGAYRIGQFELSGNNQDIIVTVSDNPSEYNTETDPYPRLLFVYSEGTKIFQDGLTTDNKTVIQEAKTIIRTLADDKDTQKIIQTHPYIQDMITNIRNVEQKIESGTHISSSDKKKLIQDTTILKKKSEE